MDEYHSCPYECKAYTLISYSNQSFFAKSINYKYLHDIQAVITSVHTLKVNKCFLAYVTLYLQNVNGHIGFYEIAS